MTEINKAQAAFNHGWKKEKSVDRNKALAIKKKNYYT